MRCPKCASAMEKADHEGIEIERCTVCRGLFFDMFELDDLKKLQGSEALDPGEAALGKNLNKVDDYPCPKCSNPMIKMVDRRQRHIWYEACSQCFGIFLDAGEFKDLKALELSDLFKAARAPKRG